MNRSEGSIRPPRWAEALLRMFLSPDEAETESGDLLEAYRDSIHPVRGRWRADIWYVRQVAGYILRACAVTNVRLWILAGLTLCILTIVFTALRYPEGLSAPSLVLIVCGILLYGYVTVRGAHPDTTENALALRLGTKWGVVIGTMWTCSWVSGNLVIPHGPGAQTGLLLALVAFLLQFVCGAHAAIKTGRVRGGVQVGFWSGLISGLMTFLAAAAIGYVLAFIPGFPGAEIPSTAHVYSAAEFERLNVMDAMGGALSQLFLFGGVLGVIGGTIGGGAGILLARTGRSIDVSTRT